MRAMNRLKGRKQEVDLFECRCPDSCAHVHWKHTQTYAYKHLHSCSCLSAYMKGEANAEREGEGVNVNLFVGGKKTGEDKVIT